MKTIEDYISNFPELLAYHEQHLYKINTAKGSNKKHQAYRGGYRVHIEQCLDIANLLYNNYENILPFEFTSVVKVLYFHDIEKIFKYTEEGIEINKTDYYIQILPTTYNIIFSTEELNALKYIHGEPDKEYCKVKLMNELAGLCHACDILSARTFHNIK